MSPTWSMVAATIGAASGPWLRAQVWARSVPFGHKLRRRCSACLHPIRTGAHLGAIAVLLPAPGRCPHCDDRIGAAPVASALIAASALGVLTWQAPTAWQALAWCWFAWCGMALAAIDAAVHRLPRPIVATATAGVAVCLLAATLLDRQPHILIRAVLAAVGLGLLYLLAVILPRNGMGLGDAALAVPVGLTTGWISLTTTALATLAAILTAGLASGALLATGRATRGDDIAYGPFMVFGALVALLASG